MRHFRATSLIFLLLWALVLGGGSLRAGEPGGEGASPLTVERALQGEEADAAEQALARLLARRGPTLETLVLLGRVRLLRGDPVAARRAFLQAWKKERGDLSALLGLARCELLLQEPRRALDLARSALARFPRDEEAASLEVRALLDLGRPWEALSRARRAREALGEALPGPDLLEALGAALFRCGLVKEAARAYERALLQRPHLAEAHIRLGTGLRPPSGKEPPASLFLGVDAFRRGDLSRAEALFEKSWRAAPADPVCHRLLGEVLLERERRRSFLLRHPVFRKMKSLLADPGPGKLPLGRFFPGYASLSPRRKAQVHRTARAWGRYLPRLALLGARHDLLDPTESATLARERARLRGRRTADGRFWDEVRGVGGFHAATGVEALDEAASFGFDTLAHEVTHQVHLFAMSSAERRRVDRLYQKALREGRCLDYYAATCPEEYLAQGFEAFLSPAKIPGTKRTHGHTRLELVRLDPDLERFLRRRAAWDPFRGRKGKALLEAAAEWALLAGRFDDVLTAADLMGRGITQHVRDLRDQALAEKVLLRGRP